MALQINPNIYTGGYERIDTRPHVQLYAQLKAREQARDDAFDEYMRNLNLKINPAGMRNQEREVFEEKLKNWQQKGIQNRDLIRNPRQDMGKAQMEFQADYQDLLNLAAESKTAAEGLKPFIEVATDPKKYNLLNKERAMGAVQSHDQPILIKDETGQYVRNPNFRPFSPSELEYYPEEIDYGKFWKDNFSEIKKSEVTERGEVDPKTMTRVDTTTASYLPEDINQIAEKAVGLLETSPRFRMDVSKLNPKDYNDIYKKAFGTDIQDEGDLAAAFALSNLQQRTEKKDIKDDIFGRQKAMEAIRNANRKGLLYLRDSLDKADTAANDLWIDEYVDRVTTESRKPENRQEYKFRDGRVVTGHKIPLDPVMRKAIGLDADKNNGLLIATDDGEFIIAPFKTDKNYQPIKGEDGKYAIDPEKAATINQDQLKLSLGKTSAGVKQTNIEMNKPSPKEGYTSVQPATYNGKKITVGVKNGKWYNTATGEEIK
jgi:hypothetical protein